MESMELRANALTRIRKIDELHLLLESQGLRIRLQAKGLIRLRHDINQLVVLGSQHEQDHNIEEANQCFHDAHLLLNEQVKELYRLALKKHHRFVRWRVYLYLPFCFGSRVFENYKNAVEKASRAETEWKYDSKKAEAISRNALKLFAETYAEWRETVRGRLLVLFALLTIFATYWFSR